MNNNQLTQTGNVQQINLIAANQTAIKELGKEIKEIKRTAERDMKDKWKIISELRKEVEILNERFKLTDADDGLGEDREFTKDLFKKE